MAEEFVPDQAAALDSRALAELQAMGLAFRTPGTPSYMMAAPPEEAFDRMLAITRHEVMTHQHELGTILNELDTLQRRRTEPAIHGTAPIDLITDPTALHPAAQQLAAETTEQYAAVISTRLLGWPSPTNPHIPITTSRIRLLYAHTEPPTIPGTETRTTSMTHLDVRISDHKKALILRPDPPTPNLLIIRSPAITALLQHWFELLWNHSTPPQNTTPTTAPYRQRILKLLAAGHRDADIARNTSTSIRTVRRHVAAIKNELNASTRFQAAITASQRGWLQP